MSTLQKGGNTVKKTLLFALTLLLAIMPLMACAAGAPANRYEKIMHDGKLIMGTAPGFPPFEFIDLTKTGAEAVVGSDISLGKYIAEQLGVDLVIETMDFATLLAAIGQGSVDIAISGMAPRAERAEVMEFSTPYNTDGYQCVVVHQDNLAQYQALSDFDGSTVAVQNAALQQDLVTEQMPGAKMEFVTNVGEGIMMVKTKKVDAVAMSGVVAELYLKSYPELAIVSQHFAYESVGTVIGIVKGELELLEAINPIVEEAENSGLYAQWRDEANTLAASQMVDESAE